MLANIAVGCLLLVVTTFVHAAAMALSFRGLKIAHTDRWYGKSRFTKATVVAVLVVAMFLASVVEATLWAAAYLFAGAIPELEESLYFSMVTYTTLGYGDVVLEGQWRLLASFQAGCGIIMFGWTTALIVAAVQHVYVNPSLRGKPPA